MLRPTHAHALLSAMLALALPAVSPTATAQAVPSATPSEIADVAKPAAPPGPPDKKIERIRVEDGGARIDELRYGGETQSITVQPKFGAPEYQVVPPDAARQRLQIGRDNSPGTSASGQRVWKIFGF